MRRRAGRGGGREASRGGRGKQTKVAADSLRLPGAGRAEVSTAMKSVRWDAWRRVRKFGLACLVGVSSLLVTAKPADDPEAERARWLELRREIARHDELYFRKGAPEISDYEYDGLKRELAVLEARFADDAGGTGGAESGGAVVGVGDDRTGTFPTARHRVPMGSLAKAHSDEELAAFHARAAARLGREDVAYRVEPKYDGLAAGLTYERGRLTRVVTRGNGAEGDDVTANARTLVRGLPERLRGGAGDWPELVELRGEIFMREAEFARLAAERRAEGEAGFANPRNLAVGTLRSRDPDEIAGRSLELVCFGWGAWEDAGAGGGAATRPESLAEFRAALEAWGLPVAAEAREATGWAELREAVAALRDAGRAGGFPTDGVVVKLERVTDQAALGDGAGAPRWAVARKFEPPRGVSRLRGVTWQVGRSGALTPVAELEPVVLAGSTITRASLHNADEIARRDLRVGDRVWVEKAGEIIPAIAGVDTAARDGSETPCLVPAECPACGRAVVREPGATGPRCANAACPARVVRRLAHYVSPQAMDVAGLGPALLDAVVARGLADSPAGLHRLTAEEWRSLPGVGAKKASQLAAAFGDARERTKRDGARLVFGLGLPGVGRETARRLAERFGGMAELGAADGEALRAAGLGEAVVRGLVTQLADPAVKAEWAELRAAGVGERWGGAASAERARGGALAGQSVVLTGRFSRWSRAEATARLREAGAEVTARVTRATTLVVAGSGPGAKRDEAARRGIAVIDEAELARRIGEADTP